MWWPFAGWPPVREHLTFALVAPIAAFGAIAVGERRTGWDRPARSAVLGLIGACLGLDRADDAAQAALAEQYGLALLCRTPGALFTDYHTVQVPPTRRGRRFATRAQELVAADLSTMLTRRDYRTGAWHLAALWARTDLPRWSLAELAAAMERPGFVPYLGRKSCPLGLPLAPRIEAAADAPTALLARDLTGPEAVALAKLRAAHPARQPTIVLDAADSDPADRRRLRIEQRRDAPLSRRRWQFALREEVVLQLTGGESA
jgi:CRISPR system Cascade subunit CasD